MDIGCFLGGVGDKGLARPLPVSICSKHCTHSTSNLWIRDVGLRGEGLIKGLRLGVRGLKFRARGYGF
jgi:hypothetical protein